MKKAILFAVVVLFGWNMSGCGVSIDTGGLLDCIKDSSACGTDEESTDSDDTADSDSEDSSDAEVASDGDTDTSGGVYFDDGYTRSKGAKFLGTYQAISSDTDYYDIAPQCDYPFPEIFRAYSHGNKLDLETQGGELAAAATIYEDETFDYDIRFSNSLGQPSVTLSCTCSMVEGYEDYTPNTMHCGCTSSIEGETLCLEYYEEL